MDPYERIAPFYDLEHADLHDDIEFYLNLLSPDGVLEVGVGTGRIMLALLEAGHEVWGVDPSAPMLEIARRKVEGYPGAHLIQGSIADVTLDRLFEQVLLPLNTLWHFPDMPAQTKALSAIRRLMPRDGMLVVDCSNPLTLADRGARGELRQRFRRMLENGRTLTGISAAWDDAAEQTLHLEFTYVETDDRGGAQIFPAEMTLRYLYRSELELQLRLAKFAIEQVYGSYDLAPYNEESPNLLMVARAE